MELRRASFDPLELEKGDQLDAELAWNQYCILRPDMIDKWINEFGSEDNAKLVKMSWVLMKVRTWIEDQRAKANLPMLTITTTGNALNVLKDEEASTYLSNRAFAGLRQHARYTTRLIASVDENNLSAAAKREHEGRVRTHSFVLASTQGAQTQLRKLRRMGKETPKLEGQ